MRLVVRANFGQKGYQEGEGGPMTKLKVQVSIGTLVIFGVIVLLFWSIEREAHRNTVSALQSAPARLSRVLGECRNDPGRLADTSQCRNAEIASAAALGRS